MTFKSSRYSTGCLLLHLVEGGLAWTSREEKSQRNRWLFVNNLGSVALKTQSLSARERMPVILVRGGRLMNVFSSSNRAESTNDFLSHAVISLAHGSPRCLYLQVGHASSGGRGKPGQ